MKKGRWSIVAFDLSLNATGYAIQSGFGTLSPPKGMNGMKRLHWIRQQTRKIVHSQETAHTLVVMEELAFTAHDRNLERAGLANLVRHRLYLDQIPYITVAPASLKKFVLGVGKGEKSQILKAVYKKWGMDCNDDNQADAAGLYYIGIGLTRQACLTRAEAEVLKTVRANKINNPVLAKLGLL